MSTYFRPIILNAFPERTWETVLRCVNQGIELADALIRQERWLNWKVGKDQRGDLRRVGAMWSLREACLSEMLPFLCEDKENTAKNCHHLEIRSQNVYLHVNRTDSLMAMPCETKLRNDARATNQFDLFKPAILTVNLAEIKTWYGWLTFNADTKGKISHLAIGLPEHNGSEWLDIIPIPLRGSSALTSVDEERPPPGPDQLVKFSESAKKMLEKPEDKGEDQKGGTEGA